MKSYARRIISGAGSAAWKNQAVQNAACAVLVLVACWITGATPAQAQDRPPPEIRAALIRSFPATIAKQRRQTPAIQGEPAVQGIEVESKVIGGKDAVKGQFKWQAAIIHSDAPANDPYSGYFCGGSLIGWRWVLTAAH